MVDYSKYIGKKYNRLTILEYTGVKKKVSHVLCKCDCGTFKEFSLKLVKTSGTKSCGCLKREKASVRLTIHGLKNHKLYSVWEGLKKRCYGENQPRYKDYGGRGISVCDKWRYNPKAFIEWSLNNGWKIGLCIDRENNNGDYTPDNCRFVTYTINNLNKRIQSNNTSGYTGVFFRKRENKFNCNIKLNRKFLLDKYSFKTAIDAAIYRDLFILENKLPHQLNLPELIYWR